MIILDVHTLIQDPKRPITKRMKNNQINPHQISGDRQRPSSLMPGDKLETLMACATK